MKNEILSKNLIQDIETKTDKPAKKLDIAEVVKIIRHILDPVEIAIQKRLKDITKLKITSHAQMQEVRNELSKDKEDYKLIQETIKKITKPAFDFKKAIDTELKRITAPFETLRELTEEKLLAFAEKKDSEEDLKGLTSRKVVKIISIDLKKVDPKYLLLNTPLINEEILSGNEIKGIVAEVVEEKGLRG